MKSDNFANTYKYIEIITEKMKDLISLLDDKQISLFFNFSQAHSVLVCEIANPKLGYV